MSNIIDQIETERYGKPLREVRSDEFNVVIEGKLSQKRRAG